MRPIFASALLVLCFAGCGTRPPLPPECEGELVPINTPVTPAQLPPTP